MNKSEQIKDQQINDPFYGKAIQYILGKIDNLQGKVVLDGGCGWGDMSVYMATQGAEVIGLDVRELSIENSRKLADICDVQDKCTFRIENLEELSLKSQSVDIIFSKSTMQYVDRDKVLDEYKRIIKPDGIIILIENLPNNPFIKIYRLHRRLFKNSEEEKNYQKLIRGYITLNEIESFGNSFKYHEHQEYHFFRMLTIHFIHLRQTNIWLKLDNILSKIDEKLFKIFPSMKYFAWYTALFCRA